MPDPFPTLDQLNLRRQIEKRAHDPELRHRPLLLFEGRRWTYGEYRDEASRFAHLLLERIGKNRLERGTHVAVLLDNGPELPLLVGACGIADITIFLVNTMLRGEPLAGVLNASGACVLIADESYRARIGRIERDLTTLDPKNIFYVAPGHPETLAEALGDSGGPAGSDAPLPDRNPRPESNLCVIYTSGTTGLPRGVVNTHQKVTFAGWGASVILETTPEDVGYAAMPLFHSSSLFNGFMAAFSSGASVVLRMGFSAREFVPDVFAHGVTWWNYVGEPVHYILEHVAGLYESDEEAIRAEITENPNNRLRYALGNGAASPNIDRFTRWFGLDDMFEHYSSTEAAITAIRKRGDPRGSVGEIPDSDIRILSESGEECAPAVYDAKGHLANRTDAVGEICMVSSNPGMFQGYFNDEEATKAKHRDGIYHSDDLGHVAIRDGKRFLHFDGRTEDWIRKDGENFSALQVSRLLVLHPKIDLVVSYGAPCPVADELVMSTILAKPGASLEQLELFDFCREQIERGSMAPIWMPDFIRIARELEFTPTSKLVSRNLKLQHYHPDRVTDVVWWRERGDQTYRTFDRDDFESLVKRFEAMQREDLLTP